MGNALKGGERLEELPRIDCISAGGGGGEGVVVAAL